MHVGSMYTDFNFSAQILKANSLEAMDTLTQILVRNTIPHSKESGHLGKWQEQEGIRL